MSSLCTHYSVQKTIQRPIISGTEDVIPGMFLENLRNKLKIKIITLDENDVVFDLVGVDASIANALRRIFLAEVPTVAIETVWIAVNTSVIQDEVLAHRVGLIPIKVDPSKLDNFVAGEEETAADTLVFHFDVECYKPPADATPQDIALSRKAYSSSLHWLPQGNQAELFPEGIAPVHGDIVVAEMREGQRIEFEAHCHRGVGKDHTKYSPVSTASYRLLPDIRFKEPVTGNLATELKNMCPMQVFDIEDIGGVKTATVGRPRDCTMCRECIRGEGWSDRVDLRRVADHFIFTVESSGCIPPADIVRQGIQILKEKAVKFHTLAVDYENGI